MDSKELRRLLNDSPFKPFTVVMAGEKSYRIEHPEFAWLNPTGRILVVATEPDEGTAILDVPLIARLELGSKQAKH